jgi:transposase
MPRKRYLVTLKADEEKLLHEILSRGKHGVQKRRRAQALPLANEGYTDEMTAERAGMRRLAVESLRQRFVADGFEVTLEGKARGHRPRALQGKDEARLIALVCGPAPEGGARWTLRLLKDRRVTLENTDTKTVSHETIRQTLKKTNLNLGKAGNGVYRRRRTRSL